MTNWSEMRNHTHTRTVHFLSVIERPADRFVLALGSGGVSAGPAAHQSGLVRLMVLLTVEPLWD